MVILTSMDKICVQVQIECIISFNPEDVAMREILWLPLPLYRQGNWGKKNWTFPGLMELGFSPSYLGHMAMPWNTGTMGLELTRQKNKM